MKPLKWHQQDSKLLYYKDESSPHVSSKVIYEDDNLSLSFGYDANGKLVSYLIDTKKPPKYATNIDAYQYLGYSENFLNPSIETLYEDKHLRALLYQSDSTPMAYLLLGRKKST